MNKNLLVYLSGIATVGVGVGGYLLGKRKSLNEGYLLGKAASKAETMVDILDKLQKESQEKES